MQQAVWKSLEGPHQRGPHQLLHQGEDKNPRPLHPPHPPPPSCSWIIIILTNLAENSRVCSNSKVKWFKARLKVDSEGQGIFALDNSKIKKTQNI